MHDAPPILEGDVGIVSQVALEVVDLRLRGPENLIPEGMNQSERGGRIYRR